MVVTFDSAKDVLNIANHGVSLALAEHLEWDYLVCRPDDTRHDYFELRMMGFAPIEQAVYCVVFVEREDEVLRVISLRKATRKDEELCKSNLSQAGLSICRLLGKMPRFAQASPPTPTPMRWAARSLPVCVVAVARWAVAQRCKSRCVWMSMWWKNSRQPEPGGRRARMTYCATGSGAMRDIQNVGSPKARAAQRYP